MEELLPVEPPSNGGVTTPVEPTLAPLIGTKRQRRPSVRLGEIGDQPAAIPSDPHLRRSKHWKLPSTGPGDQPAAIPSDPHLRRSKHWKLPSTGPGDQVKRPYHHHAANRHPSKTRHLTTIAPGGDDGADLLPHPIPPLPDEGAIVPGIENPDSLGTGARSASRDPKPWRGARRARSSWVSKADEGVESADFKAGVGEDAADEGFPEGSGSQSERNDRRSGARVRVYESRDAGPDVEGDLPSETDGGDWNDRDGPWRSGDDGGVRSWLEGLGLHSYAPVFQIHEVDDEVLPLLTLEDLKDMGINAVGTRRKMFCAIQRLRKNLDS